jgi:hypothetical protein
MKPNKLKTRNLFATGALSLALFPILGLVPESRAATHVTTVHPSYTLTTLRPGSFRPTVGGLAMLSDGRLVVGSWLGTRTGCCPSGNLGNRQNVGKVYVLSGVSAESPTVSIDTIATGLEDIMGLTVVNDVIYVSGGNQILRLNRTGNNGPVTSIDTVFQLPGVPQTSGANAGDSLYPVKGRSEWMYGLLARSDTFFVNPSSMYNANNTSQVNPYRGRALAVSPGNGTSNKRGSFRTIGTGFRHHTGLTFGPEGTIWTNETQGHWVPTNKLIRLKEGAHYGYRHAAGSAPLINPDPDWANLPEEPAAVFLPQEGAGGSGTMNSQGVFSNSPGAPLYLTQGPYAGQILMGDVSWGGIQRYFVEKVNGEWQGAGFAWMGGLESTPYRLVEGSDGQIYLGMMGTTGDWSWNGQFYGLQKLRYNGTPTFEMLAVRSRAQGMEIEFTMPVDTAIAQQASSYIVRTYAYNPSSAYGGSKMSGTLTTLTPSAIQISPDRKRVYLALTGLVARTTTGATAGFGTHRIVEVNIRKSYRSSTNTAPRDTIAFYTLNAISTSTPFSDTVAVGVDARIAAKRLGGQLTWKLAGNFLEVRSPFRGAYTMRVADLRGKVLASVTGRGEGVQRFPVATIRNQVTVLEASGDGVSLRKTLLMP